MTDLQTIATQIKAASCLASLHDHLMAFEDEVATNHADYDGAYDLENIMSQNGVDLGTLPTFGGIEPRDTSGVWSWDEDNLLVGTGSFAEWHIVERES
jgi:hypothetical protein